MIDDTNKREIRAKQPCRIFETNLCIFIASGKWAELPFLPMAKRGSFLLDTTIWEWGTSNSGVERPAEHFLGQATKANIHLSKSHW